MSCEDPVVCVVASDRKLPALPWSGLLALACAGFVTILTEALPAGLLPQLAGGFGISESMAGQLITVYALGSLLAVIPLIAWTRHWNRRPLLLLAIIGFAVANAVTACSPWYAVTLLARFFAGISAGLLWALLAGHASAMVSSAQQGRAIAVAMVGTPLALSLGIPLGTMLGQTIGWRMTFGLMSLLCVGLLAWVRVSLPDFPGKDEASPLQLRKVLQRAGVARVLAVLLLFVLAHNVLYTYIAPLLEQAQLKVHTGGYLLFFGVAALAGIWLMGLLIDRWMQGLAVLGVVVFLVSATLMAQWPASAAWVTVGLAGWGIAFGGAGTLFQTAIARRAGDAGDVAQAMVVVTWNLAIAGGGLWGGTVLGHWGAQSLSVSVLPLLGAALVLAMRGKAFAR